MRKRGAQDFEMTASRIALLVMSLSFACLYCWVLFVAFATSGSELMHDTVAYYAAIAPLAYCAFCIVTSFVRMPRGWLVGSGVVVHAAVTPALWHSFMLLGLFLPVLTIAWLVVAFEHWRTSGQGEVIG